LSLWLMGCFCPRKVYFPEKRRSVDRGLPGRLRRHSCCQFGTSMRIRPLGHFQIPACICHIGFPMLGPDFAQRASASLLLEGLGILLNQVADDDRAFHQPWPLGTSTLGRGAAGGVRRPSLPISSPPSLGIYFRRRVATRRRPARGSALPEPRTGKLFARGASRPVPLSLGGLVTVAQSAGIQSRIDGGPRLDQFPRAEEAGSTARPA